jgi:hypothetical protein
MCLRIKSDQVQNERDLNKWFGNRTKFAYVYKVLIKRTYEDFYRSACFLDYIWNFRKEKVFEVSRSPKPGKEELDYGRINKGLHVYVNLEEAKKNKYSYNTIVKFRVRKEDIVAIENNRGNRRVYHNSKELVCTRLEFVKVLED